MKTKKAAKKATKVAAEPKKKKKTGPAIGERKNLLYIYPKDCDSLEKRKLFRAMVRKKLVSLKKAWKSIESGKKEGNVAEAKAAYFKFKKGNVAKAEEKAK